MRSGPLASAWMRRDRLTAITNGQGQTLTFELDASGRRQRVTDQTGFAIVYEYNQHGFLEAVRDRNGSLIMNYAYDTAGRLERETRGNGVTTTYAYDANGRLIELTHTRADGPLERFSYAYSRNGKCASVRNLAGQETRFAYDRAGRLARVDYADGDFETFTYDTVGNRTAVTSTLGTVSYAANALHQYTRAGDRSFTYDPAGNLIGDGARAFSYDAEGRLTQIDVAGAHAWRCEYDALGQRLRTASSSETNRFLLDPTGIGWVVSELDDAGVTRARYLYGLRLIARIDESGAIQYYGFDRAGHTRLLTDAAGAVLNTYAYSPFGEERTIDETVDNPYRFGGAWGARCDSQGLLFMRRRYYDPQLGRYLSPDPLRLAGGPHLYAYAANDPVNLFDPDGLSGGPVPDPKDVSWNLVKGNKPQEIVKDNAVKWLLRQIVDGIDDITDFDPDTIQKIEEMPTEDNMYKELMGEPNQQFSPQQIEAAEKGLKDTVVDVLSKLVQGVTWKDLIPDPDWDATQPNSGADPAPTPMFTPEFIDLTLDVQGESVTPGDPNEKTGSASSGVNGIATPDDTLHYTIYFENDPRLANAPAQEVTITDALDPNLDWSTFRLAEIGWGAITVPLPADAAQVQTYVTVPDYRPEIDKAWRVDIAAAVGAAGTAVWSMRTIDPLTEDLPLDAMAGFLPVNDDTGRGQGHVAFTIRPLPGLAAGTQLANRATIRFDLEATIQTDIVVFTLAGPLGSEIKNLEVAAGQLRFLAERLVPQVPATLEQSSDLRQWTPVQVVTPTGTTHAFDVPIAVDPSRMFFRLRQEPMMPASAASRTGNRPAGQTCLHPIAPPPGEHSPNTLTS